MVNIAGKLMIAMTFFALLAGCSGELSRGEAEDIIWEFNKKEKMESVTVGYYGKFGRPEIKFDVNHIPYEISIKGSRKEQLDLSNYTMSELPDYLQFYLENDFISVELPKKVQTDSYNYVFALYNVKLTDKAMPFFVKLYRPQDSMRSNQINVEIIDRKLDKVDVTGIVGDDRQAIVQATIIYKKTDISNSEKEYSEYKKKLQFLKYDDGWRIGKVINSSTIDW